MTDFDAVAGEVAAAIDWNARVAILRRIPEAFSIGVQPDLYARIAEQVYVPDLAPDFAYARWREEYELAPVREAYRLAHEHTAGFTKTDFESLTATISARPQILLVFRLLLGLTALEFVAVTQAAAERHGFKALTSHRLRNLEAGSACSRDTARCCAWVVDKGMRGELFGRLESSILRPKIDKPDTQEGWTTVQRYATEGVPLDVFLHQRHYGGSFRQLGEATSSRRGDLLKDAVEELLQKAGVAFLRTDPAPRETIMRRFGLTVRPVVDFVILDGSETLRALVKCEIANDGEAAREKADRFNNLRYEASRLGGVPLFAVLAGLGWSRTDDALGPVVRDTEGRVFTLLTLVDLLLVQPFPELIRG